MYNRLVIAGASGRGKVIADITERAIYIGILAKQIRGLHLLPSFYTFLNGGVS